MKDMKSPNHARWSSADGPELSEALSSFDKVLSGVTYAYKDMYKICEVEQIVREAAHKFLNAFYQTYVYGSEVYNQETDTSFKNRRKDLESFIGTMAEKPRAFAVLSNNREYSITLDQLKYYPQSGNLKLILIEGETEDESDWNVLDIVINHSKPKMFACLFKAVAKIYQLIQSYEGLPTDTLLQGIYRIALQLCSVSQIGAYFGTLEEEKVQFLKESYERLTGDRSKDHLYFEERDVATLLCDESLGPNGRDIIHRVFKPREVERFKGVYIHEVFDAVCAAIKRRDKSFSSLIGSTLRSLRRYDQEKGELGYPAYDTGCKDLYVSLRANPSKMPPDYLGKYWNRKKRMWERRPIRESILKSAFESDCLKGKLDEFDRKVGFWCEYTSETKYDGDLHKVILIDNPNKYKPRIIHLFNNCINDRLNYLGHQMDKRHRADKTLCTEQHRNGREFVRIVTSPAYRQQAHMVNASACITDWSNATDEYRQDVQYKVLDALYGEEFSNVWKEVMKIPFKMYFPKGYKHLIGIQENGNSQGGPGSFTSFTDLGETLDQTATAITGNLQRPYEEQTCAVGDDRIKVWYNDPKCIGFAVSALVYSWAGIKVNGSKSTILYPDDPVWTAEFCKVTSKDGQYFTKIPHGLLFGVKDEASWLGTMSWCQLYGYNVSKHVEEHLRQEYGEVGDLMWTSLEEGWSRGFQQFQTKAANEGWGERESQFHFCYTIAHLRSLVVDALLNDRTQQYYQSDGFSLWKSIENFFHGPKNFNRVLESIPAKHKLIALCDESLVANSLIRDICCSEYTLEDVPRLPIFQALGLDDNVLAHLSVIADVYNCIKQDNPARVTWSEIWAGRGYQIDACCKALLSVKGLHRFNELSLSKIGHNTGRIFSNTIDLFQEISPKHDGGTSTDEMCVS